jgi:CRISPR-associated endonuclease/helicase Cas3
MTEVNMALYETFKLLQDMIYVLANAEEGLSTSEIAHAFGVTQRSIQKYIHILEDAGIPIYEDSSRYFIDSSYTVPFTLTLEESEFLFLALERSFFFHQKRWRTMQSLLNKIGRKLPDHLTEFIMRQKAQQDDRWFALLTDAKYRHYEVWVDYHPLNVPEPKRWLIRPFRFISNPLSDGFYILCEGTQDGHAYIPLSLKFDRILRVQATDKHFEIAQLAAFKNYEGFAWGVWNSYQEPVKVCLQFEPRHYDRLLETTWHPTQQIEVDNNNYVFFSVSVSEPQEMIPWIRSWGSGVVVLEPEDVRQRVIWSLQRQLKAYGLEQSETIQDDDLLIQLWAKYDRKTGAYHALIYHLFDVAAVAWVMWERVLSESQRNWVANLLEVDSQSAQNMMALFAGIHDIGKATTAFQQKAAPLYDRLIASGLPDETISDVPHGILSAVILKQLLQDWGMPKKATGRLASAIGGHHGAWISTTKTQNNKGALGHHDWRKKQTALFENLASVLKIDSIQFPKDHESINKLCVFISGFISVCDWIGSNDTYFQFETEPVKLDVYFHRAIQQAEVALAEMGWLGWHADSQFPLFESIFPFSPNTMQKTAIAALKNMSQPPRLILIEYLTGGGKTELALYLADIITNLVGKAGVCVAMPTQATSNQMFERVSKFLEERYPHQPINLHLLHAQADQHPLYQQLQTRLIREGDESGLAAESWFHNRKRTLLAPFGVGTVDQIMMSVLQTRHHFVRQYAISHKTIVFDEVHAYDTFMSAIIERLLNWSVSLQTPTIMLSATLPQKTREKLIKQVTNTPYPDDETAYPRMTVVDHHGEIQVYALPAPEPRKLFLHHIAIEVESLCEFLAPIYADGGCIAIVCNTVDESIAIADALQAHQAFLSDDILLFHGRFPPAWRNEIENEVLEAFGKIGDRPDHKILVATQIIEQSLDLDFDLMVSCVAPVDLLIQRAGRLHRHPERERPQHLKDPVLVLRDPQLSEVNLPDFGVDEVIYARFILLKTWLLLEHRAELILPDEIDAVMNFVYDEATSIASVSEDYNDALQTAWDDMDMNEHRAAFKGKQFLIGTPDDERLIGNTPFDLPDDETIRPTTRDMQAGIDIICMGTGAGKTPLPKLLDRPPTRDEITHLMRCRITIYRKDIKESLEELDINPHWHRIPQLRRARAIFFSNGSFAIPNSLYVLKLSSFYGLQMIKEEE